MELQKDLVSVIMSNYNTDEEYLRASIESVLNQTYENFEFIIIDDCSTNNSVEIIESYRDSRIRLIKNKENLGLTKSLNVALKVARGEYIARMDADDVCLPQRFEKQVLFLSQNPEYIVCGTAAEFVGVWQKYNSQKVIFRKIPEKEEYRIRLLFENNPNIVHISAMFNATIMRSFNIEYNENYKYAQDYRMWVSCCEVAECANLEDVLMQITVREGTISTSKREEQEECVIRIIQEQLDKLHICLDEETVRIHRGLLKQRKEYTLNIKKWIKKLISQNRIYNVYNQKILEKLLWEKWAEISYFGLASQKNPIEMLKIFINIPIMYIPVLFRIKKHRKNK
ncbi:MAG: glycosyltransferase family 2 protein [Clostridia bacterium]|nr:glycosyltransferase family 2 protein [Clostridia bacterium]